MLITDCVWNNWEPWSSCSKSCVQDVDMSLGTAQRNRTFVEPTNGGLNCDESKAIEVRNCPRVDDEDITTAFIFCPGNGQLFHESFDTKGHLTTVYFALGRIDDFGGKLSMLNAMALSLFPIFPCFFSLGPQCT